MTDLGGQKVWEVRVFVGRDPISAAPRQLTRMVHDVPCTQAVRPAGEVIRLGEELQAEATKLSGGDRAFGGTLAA
jgi:hypothetical protein